jgi:predicted flap endonuclease-1-like 5' DNA nuclease
MPDKSKPQEGGPHKKQTGQGSKDSKLTKRNKNVTSALPDREKEAREVADVSERMAAVETVFEPWQKRVIDLQAQGWSFARIIEAGENRRKQTGTARPGRRVVELPSRQTLFESTREHPEFKETCERAYAFAVDSEAQRGLELSVSLDKEHEDLLRILKKPPKVDGLDPAGKALLMSKFMESRIPVTRDLVNARDKRIQRTLQIAGRIHPDKWGEQATSEREVIVFEPYGGWVPTNTLKGSPGQGGEAESAVERWKKMREEAKDA